MVSFGLLSINSIPNDHKVQILLSLIYPKTVVEFDQGAVSSYLLRLMPMMKQARNSKRLLDFAYWNTQLLFLSVVIMAGNLKIVVDGEYDLTRQMRSVVEGDAMLRVKLIMLDCENEE